LLLLLLTTTRAFSEKNENNNKALQMLNSKINNKLKQLMTTSCLSNAECNTCDGGYCNGDHITTCLVDAECLQFACVPTYHICSSNYPAGHPCSTLVDCANGLTCLVKSKICAIPRVLGEQCDGTRDCDTNKYYCDITTTNICKALGDVDDYCDANAGCARGLTCDNNNNKCVLV
jgi:hypothetical protein